MDKEHEDTLWALAELYTEGNLSYIKCCDQFQMEFHIGIYTWATHYKLTFDRFIDLIRMRAQK